MPEYRIIQAWIHKESNIIYVGYKEKLEEVLKDADLQSFVIISETSQKRLGFKLRDLARKHKENNKPAYSVKFHSGFVTLDNIIRSYSFREGLFKKALL